MGRKRQKNQLLLAFMAEDRDEFPRAAEGTEPPVAKRNSESPTQRLTSRTAVVRTRTPGGVTGTAREGLPMSMYAEHV
jgi:hypothetical protein